MGAQYPSTSVTGRFHLSMRHGPRLGWIGPPGPSCGSSITEQVTESPRPFPKLSSNGSRPTSAKWSSSCSFPNHKGVQPIGLLPWLPRLRVRIPRPRTSHWTSLAVCLRSERGVCRRSGANRTDKAWSWAPRLWNLAARVRDAGYGTRRLKRSAPTEVRNEANNIAIKQVITV